MIRRSLPLLALTVLLAAAPAPADWTGGGKSEIPLEGDGKFWLVHATLNGNVSGLFLLDTGASLCVLAPTTARRLRLRETGEQAGMRTANGVVNVPLVQIHTVDVGGNRARDVPAVVHTAVGPPLDGIVGLSYLNNFSYAIDPRRRVLRLR